MEGSNGHVNGIAIVAGGASIGDGAGHGLVVLGIEDLYLLTAKVRLLAGVTVLGGVHGYNEVVIAVDGTAGASDTILVEEGTESTSDQAGEVTKAGRG